MAKTTRGSLSGTIAVVAGATRGAGRGIAVSLGEEGATVYCTGRSSRRAGATLRKKPARGKNPFDLSRRPETIEETAELVTAAGGRGIPVRVDHTKEKEVKALFARVKKEQRGRLDLLVNDIWGGDELAEDKPFWEQSFEKGLAMLERGVHTHLLTSRWGAPLLVARGKGLIVEVTDGDSLAYRGTVFYDLVKTNVIRLAFAMSEELLPRGVASIAVTPGFLRSEVVLDYFGVTEKNWRDAGKKDPHFLQSETPRFVGRGIAALAADPDVLTRTGGIYSSWGLSRDYGFTDVDGESPDFGRHAATEPVFLEQDKSHARYLEAFVRGRAR
jgi:NAD(P)-dependent dehydrogenase (short-subunit alcohol dehydrogenase family)